jgi:hypothetical protein
MQMDDLKEKTADLADHVEDFANTFYKLTVLNITQKTTNITSAIILTLLTAILGFLILLFCGIALSWWLGDLVQSRTGGFLLGGAFFLILLLILASIRKKIIFPFIRNLIIRKFYD